MLWHLSAEFSKSFKVTKLLSSTTEPALPRQLESWEKVRKPVSVCY